MDEIKFFNNIENRLDEFGIKDFKPDELITYQEEIINWLKKTDKYDDFFDKLALEIVKADDKIVLGENNEKDWLDELFTMSHEIFFKLIESNNLKIFEYIERNYALEIDDFISQLKERNEKIEKDISVEKQIVKILLLINNLVYRKFFEIENDININNSQQVRNIDINSQNDLGIRIDFFNAFVDWVKNINIIRENIIMNKINNQDGNNHNSDDIILFIKMSEFTGKKNKIQDSDNYWYLGVKESVEDFLKILKNNENNKK